MKEYPLSEMALQALNEILSDWDLDSQSPSRLLDDVLDVLGMIEDLTVEDVTLMEELEAMPDRARESLSRAVAVARGKE